MKERLLSFFPSPLSQSKLEVSDGDKEAAARVGACVRSPGGREGAGQWVSKVKWEGIREQRSEGGNEKKAGYRVVRPKKQNKVAKWQ